VIPVGSFSALVVACAPVFRGELPVPRFSPGTVRHTAVVARVGIELEHSGLKVLSEREILAAERIAGERIYSAPMGGRHFHRPDLVAVGDTADAIEVELVSKAAHRIDAILRAWRRAVMDKRFARVRYFCAGTAAGSVRRSMGRVKAREFISVTELARRELGLKHLRI
jgi:hypothetical protein